MPALPYPRIPPPQRPQGRFLFRLSPMNERFFEMFLHRSRIISREGNITTCG